MAERITVPWRAATWADVEIDDTVLALWPGRPDPVEAAVVAIERETQMSGRPRARISIVGRELRPDLEKAGGWRAPRVRLEREGWQGLWRPYEPSDIVFVKSQFL